MEKECGGVVGGKGGRGAGRMGEKMEGVVYWKGEYVMGKVRSAGVNGRGQWNGNQWGV